MGQEIQHDHFRKQDFDEYHRRLKRETELLQGLFDEHCFADDPLTAGFEMEAWLVNDREQPLPENERFLEAANSDLLCPELARFNVEINSVPRVLKGNALCAMQSEFEQTWQHCNAVCHDMDASLVMVGILPSLQEHEIVLENISSMTRYRALNEQVRRMREGAPLKLDIEGRERHFKTWHKDVMLESAATSFQLHLQVPEQHAVRAYNAAMVASAPLVALTANSPYLFGYDLWDETRIPVFEQAVSVCAGNQFSKERVSFGSDYAHESLMECFIENLEEHPVLLPELIDADESRLSHLRLHNGTIWRWNRPLIGFDENGRPHLRIEHRVIPAGPSIIDSFANAAIFFGLMAKWISQPDFTLSRLSFKNARANFYAAAREGFNAEIRWLDGCKTNVLALWQDSLLADARQGLMQLEIDRNDIDRYIGVIQGRIESGVNGAVWQRAFVAKHGPDMHALTAAYHENQRRGAPVHQWKI